MNWTPFLLGLLAIYGLYYALNVLYDLFIHRSHPAKSEEGEELTFEDDAPPEKVMPSMREAVSQPVINIKKQMISRDPLKVSDGRKI